MYKNNSDANRWRFAALLLLDQHQPREPPSQPLPWKPSLLVTMETERSESFTGYKSNQSYDL